MKVIAKVERKRKQKKDEHRTRDEKIKKELKNKREKEVENIKEIIKKLLTNENVIKKG